MDISHAQATTLIDAALAHSETIQVPVSIAVLDSGRELVAFARRDGAPLLSTEVAQAKAFTARSLNMATADVGPLTQPGAPLFGLEVSSRHRLVSFAGGRPVEVDSTIVGAIGVSGGTVEQDDEIALAALKAVTG
jgi:uncharacterized protein GlcG (DUF336 family)